MTMYFATVRDKIDHPRFDYRVTVKRMDGPQLSDMVSGGEIAIQAMARLLQTTLCDTDRFPVQPLQMIG